MKNRWFEERKDLFFKELVHTFLESKILFDELYRTFKQCNAIAFERMDFWVGSEIKKGPLWNLKDTSHKLFRKSESKISLSEYLFDWTLGSIFHEAMKLKEDAYQLEVYLPSYDKIDASLDAKAIRKILKEYFTVIDNATHNVKEEMEQIHYLFSKAAVRLEELLITHATNGILIRFLLKNEALIENALGKNSFSTIISSLYPQQPEKAHIVVADSYLMGGWFKDAIALFNKALAINPNCAEARKKLLDIEKKQK